MFAFWGQFRFTLNAFSLTFWELVVAVRIFLVIRFVVLGFWIDLSFEVISVSVLICNRSGFTSDLTSCRFALLLLLSCAVFSCSFFILGWFVISVNIIPWSFSKFIHSFASFCLLSSSIGGQVKDLTLSGSKS